MSTKPPEIKSLIAAGLSLVPVNSSKIPVVRSWKNGVDAKDLYSHSGELAIAAGSASGGVECIDIDLKYDITGTLWKQYCQRVKESDDQLLKKLVVQRTPTKGYHLIYKCEELEGNQKLAQRPTTNKERTDNPHQKRKVLVETRGEGGYFLIDPSKDYKILQGNLTDIPVISIDEREILFNVARMFDEIPKEKVVAEKRTDESLPGDDYNNKADVLELLQKHGWKIVSDNGQDVRLKRPGDTKSKWGANYNRHKNLFYVFTTSTEFESDKAYTPFTIYSILEHNSDFSKAAKCLADQGYGKFQFNTKPKTEQELECIVSEGYDEELIFSLVDGTFEQGKGFGIKTLDKHLRWKSNQYYLIVAKQNIGKTLMIVYLMKMLAAIYDMKFLILTMENDIWQIKRDLAQFYLKKIIRQDQNMNDDVKMALKWVNKHFRFMDPMMRYSVPSALRIAKKLFNTWEFDGFMIDPYNALWTDFDEIPVKSDYSYHLECSNAIQHFSKTVASVVLSCHITGEASRRKGPPSLDDVQYGVPFTAKCHDGIVLYREPFNPEEKYVTDIFVEKIKDKQSGGEWTSRENPVRLQLLLSNEFRFADMGEVPAKLERGNNVKRDEKNDEEKDDLPF